MMMPRRARPAQISASQLITLLVGAVFALVGIIPLFLAIAGQVDPSDYKNLSSPIYMAGRSFKGGTTRY